MERIEFKDVSVAVHGTPILKNISLALNQGELVALMGPNGAGKTTLMRTAAGVVPYEGSLCLNGKEISGISIKDRAHQFSYISQMQDVHWPMRVYDIVSIGRLPFKTMTAHMKDDDHAAVLEALHATGMEAFSERSYESLSGGEKARVMISRALAAQTEILLADEPTSALDPFHQLHILEVLKDHTKKGSSVLAIFHDILHAAQFSDRVVLMQDGKIQYAGPPKDVLTPKILGEIYNISIHQKIDLTKGLWTRKKT